MALSPTASFLIILLLVCFVLAQETDKDRWDIWWNYQPGVSGPDSWGGFNLAWKMCSVGKRQSPIDIIPNDLIYDSNLKHFSLSKHKVPGTLLNTGHDLTVEIDSSVHKIALSDGPLSYHYMVSKVVIHFGGVDRQGSEHKIDGKSFSAEVQIYAYNDQLYPNITAAEKENSGLAAVSIMVAVNDSGSSNIGSIINDVSRVQYKGTEKPLSKFSVFDLLPETHNYMTYEGSMTRPGCSETVTWIVMNKPVYITSQQLSLLRQTVSTEQNAVVKHPLENNYRPVRSLNRRAVRTNINFPHQKSSVCDLKREKVYTVNQQVLASLNQGL